MSFGGNIFRGLPLFFGGSGDPSEISLLGRPLLRGLLVPGGAVRFTVQYEPKPGSVTGLG